MYKHVIMLQLLTYLYSGDKWKYLETSELYTCIHNPDIGFSDQELQKMVYFWVRRQSWKWNIKLIESCGDIFSLNVLNDQKHNKREDTFFNNQWSSHLKQIMQIQKPNIEVEFNLLHNLKMTIGEKV